MKNLTKKKILIIEDDRSLQDALTEMLKREGYKVINAFDGEEGLQKAEKDLPDLILLDIILPRKDGYEVLKEIKQGKPKDAPVLVLTNLAEASNVQKAISLGATTFMVKADFSLEDILEKVRENLR